MDETLGAERKAVAEAERPRDIQNPYVFVVGCPRSGTTLLQRMLDQHPRLAVANDTHFIPKVLQALQTQTDLNLTAPSDYGRTFHALLHSHLRPRGRDTLLVVLGDARTNRFDPLPWALEELSRRCRGVIWLLPEPRGRWGTGDSALADYLPYVDALVEAWDLEGLARGLVEVVRRI